MPKLLKVSVIDTVGFVDRGANPAANILIFKRAGFDKATKRENGQDFPASAFAYVPDAEKPSTWKLRLTEDPGADPTAAQVGRAVAALGKGFRGNKVQIPTDDLAGVKRKVLAAWRKTHPDSSKEDEPAVLKSDAGFLRRVLGSLSNALGLSATDLEKAFDEARTFEEQRAQRDMERVTSEVWQMVWDLSDAVSGTLRDDEESDKENIIRRSIAQFTAAFDTALPTWLAGETVEKVGRKISGARLKRLKGALTSLQEIIEEAEEATSTEKRHMPDLDLSTLPEEAQTEFEALQKRADEAEQARADAQTELEKLQAAAGDGGDGGGDEEDVLKDADPAIRKYLEAQQERIEKAETEAAAAKKTAEEERGKRELAELEKRAEQELGGLVGTVAEKAQLLQSIREGLELEEAEQIEKMLAAASEGISKSRLFSVIGSDGTGDEGSAYARVRARAVQLVEKGDGPKTLSAAMNAVLEADPDLRKLYNEENRAEAQAS